MNHLKTLLWLLLRFQIKWDLSHYFASWNCSLSQAQHVFSSLPVINKTPTGHGFVIVNVCFVSQATYIFTVPISFCQVTRVSVLIHFCSQGCPNMYNFLATTHPSKNTAHISSGLWDTIHVHHDKFISCRWTCLRLNTCFVSFPASVS